MKFLQASISLAAALFLSSAMAAPCDSKSGCGPHHPPPHKSPKIEGNSCSSGTPYCCDVKDGKNNCIASEVECETTVICCNNDFGRQLCVGDLDFNQSINIAVKQETNNIQDGDNISVNM